MLIGEIDGAPAAALSLEDRTSRSPTRSSAPSELRVYLRMRAAALEAVEREPSLRERMLDAVRRPAAGTLDGVSLSHLQRLEAESIHIMREVAAEAERPVMLYSIGKDSAVMLHLAMKAFHPGQPPFPLLHVDTTWKFREMYEFRDRMAAELGLDLIVQINEEGLARGHQPVRPRLAGPHRPHEDGGRSSRRSTQHRFDAAFGGARRDEEKSRAKERVFSFRAASTAGTRRTSGPSCGTSTTRASAAASRSASSRCPTGPSSTSGSTSTGGDPDRAAVLRRRAARW